jgi:hypothetical protein
MPQNGELYSSQVRLRFKLEQNTISYISNQQKNETINLTIDKAAGKT